MKSKTKAIEILRELVESLRYYPLPKTNAVTRAYQKAKEFLEEIDLGKS